MALPNRVQASMMTLAASDSTARAPRLALVHSGDAHGPTPRPDVQERDFILGSLLAREVYVIDYEIVLEHDGPYYELQPTDDPTGQRLVIYTSRQNLPATVDPQDAETMSTRHIVEALEQGVGLSVDPGQPSAYLVAADELDLLRQVARTH